MRKSQISKKTARSSPLSILISWEKPKQGRRTEARATNPYLSANSLWHIRRYFASFEENNTPSVPQCSTKKECEFAGKGDFSAGLMNSEFGMAEIAGQLSDLEENDPGSSMPSNFEDLQHLVATAQDNTESEDGIAINRAIYDDEGVENMPIITMQDYRKLYNFFCAMQVPRLRLVCKNWKIPGNVNKIFLIARCIVHAITIAEEKSIDGITATLERNPACEGFKDFDRSQFSRWVIKPPTLEYLVKQVQLADETHQAKVVRALPNPEKQAEKRKEKAKPLSLNETARLLVILRGVNGRAALRKSREDLSATQKEKEFTRANPWDTVIEPLFNDSELQLTYEFNGDGYLEDVSISDAPQRYIPGPMLRQEFEKLRSKFHSLYKGWSKVGNLNVRSVIDHIINEHGEVTTLSKQMILFFEVTGIGTSDIDDDLLSLFSSIPEDNEIVDVEKALASVPSVSAPSYLGSSGSRKRKQSEIDATQDEKSAQREVNEAVKSFVSGIVYAMHGIKTPQVQPQITSAEKLNQNLGNTITVSDYRERLFEAYEKAQDNLKKAIASEDQAMISVAQQNFDWVQNEWNKYFGAPSSDVAMKDKGTGTPGSAPGASSMTPSGRSHD